MRNLYIPFIFLIAIISCKEVKNTTNKSLEIPAKNNISSVVSDFKKLTMEQSKKGVDFYAQSEDASWTLSLDFDKEFHFKTSTGILYNAPAVLPVIAQDYHVKRYRTVTKEGELIIQIIASECNNGLKGSKQSYKVSINFKTISAKDYINFKGCGSYIPDLRLHDIWAIIEVDGLKINPSTFKKNAPLLEINSFEQTVMGADGCNTLRGQVYNEYDIIYFNKLMGTRMACPDQQQISLKINKVLNTKGLTYTIKNNLLVFTHNNQQLMVLKHID